MIAQIIQQQSRFSIGASAPVETADGFTLAAPALTSAGVYNSSGALVRILWGAEQKAAGAHQPYWDCKDDAGTLVADGTYQILVQENNLEVEWGIVGNSSDFSTGSTVHHASAIATSMCFPNATYGYYCIGYNEGYPAFYKFNTATPQQKIEVLSNQGQVTHLVCTDGSRVFFNGFGVGATQFVFALNVADDSEVIFSSGTSNYNTGGGRRTYASTIDFTTSAENEPNPDYSGLLAQSCYGFAVQPSGKYLFASYIDTQEIHVLNVDASAGTPTGALVQNITTFTKPRAMATTGSSLWVISGANTVSKHTVNSNGSLSTAVLTLSGLVKPLDIKVSPDGATVAVVDGGSKQQVKFFNNTSGAEGTPLGQLGGYSTSALVANDKFIFNNGKQLYLGENSFIAFHPDGSFWLGDQGNQRQQHFAANKTFIETVEHSGFSYSAFADRNDPSRIFSNYLEYQVDHTLPLAPRNGSWKLHKNWLYPLTQSFTNESFDNQFNRLRFVTTLDNGKTYAFLNHYFYTVNGTTGLRENTRYRWRPVELTAMGNLRFAAADLSFNGNVFNTDFVLNSDGSLTRITSTDIGQTCNFIRNTQTGYDGDNFPTWDADVIIGTTGVLQTGDPINELSLRENQITASGKALTHSASKTTGYHLGGVVLGTPGYNFKTSPSTSTTYRGEFPYDGWSDNGNDTNNNTGNFAMAIDNIITWGFHGEGYKGGQCNFWNLFSDKGLFLKQFGTDGETADELGEAQAGMAGNALTGTIMKLSNGDIVLVHNDEGQHSAVHVWRIKNASSIQNHVIPFVKSGAPAAPVLDYVNVMSDVPYRGTLTSGTGKWTTSTNDTGVLNINTSITTYRKDQRDFRIFSDGQSRSVKGNIGNNVVINWKIKGEIAFPASSEPGDNLFEILDSAERVICRISRPQTNNGATLTIKANANNIVSDATSMVMRTIRKLHPISIVSTNGSLAVTFANYATVTVSKLDTLADANNPSFVKFSTNSIPAEHFIDIANLKFYPQ